MSTSIEDLESSEPTSHVSFVISKAGLDPDKISQILGLVPDRTHLEGDYPNNNSKFSAFKDGMWSLDSTLAHEEPFPDHLENLLIILLPKQAEILELSKDNEIRFYCTLFAQQGFELPPNLMSQISSLGASLGVTLYP